MYIYDDTSLTFIKKSEEMVKKILHSMNLKVQRSKFVFKGYLYPIRVVVFEGTELGHFNGPYLQIGLNRKLIYSAKDSAIIDILKHELAHYLTYLEYGEVPAHGKEFKEICERFHISSEIANATMNLEMQNEKVGNLASERVLEKVKKLLQLADSSNPHEAELATLKANSLLIRHNLEYIQSDDGPIYMERLLIRKRKDAKLVAIYEILRHFIIRPVISQGKEACSIEVSGTLTNVKLAIYVAEFLNRELDQLWLHAKKENAFQGLRAKNSFFHGVAKGYAEKVKNSRQELSTTESKALVLCEQKLDHAVLAIYGRLGSTRSHAFMDSEANAAGFNKGHSLSVRPGLEGSGKNLYLSSY